MSCKKLFFQGAPGAVSRSRELHGSLVSQLNTLYFYPALGCAPQYLLFCFSMCLAQQGEKPFADRLALARREGCPAPQGSVPAPLALLSPSAQSARFQMSPAPAQPAWGPQSCQSLQCMSDQGYGQQVCPALTSRKIYGKNSLAAGCSCSI